MSEDTKKSPEEAMQELFDSQYAKACEDHKRAVGWIDEDYGPIIFRKADRPQMKRFIKELTEDNPEIYLAQEALAKGCAYYPKGDDMTKLFDELPGLAAEACTEIQQLSQARGKKQVKRRR